MEGKVTKLSSRRWRGTGPHKHKSGIVGLSQAFVGLSVHVHGCQLVQTASMFYAKKLSFTAPASYGDPVQGVNGMNNVSRHHPARKAPSADHSVPEDANHS